MILIFDVLVMISTLCPGWCSALLDITEVTQHHVYMCGLSLVGLHYCIMLLTYEHLYMFPSVVDYVPVLSVVAHKDGSVTRQTTYRRENCMFISYTMCT